MIIETGNKYLDIETWPNKLAAYGHRICRIDVSDGQLKTTATGFLVGPDIVLTSYHNIAPQIGYSATIDPKNMILRFGYRYLSDERIDPGTTYRLVQENWLIDWSPAPSGLLKTRSQALNYALLRVEGSPGLEAVTGMYASPIRGWIEIPSIAKLPHPGEPLLSSIWKVPLSGLLLTQTQLLT